MNKKTGAIAPKRRMVFVHVPKCGGTTVYSSLAPLFEKAMTSHDHSDANAEGDQTPFVSTHIPYSELRTNPEEDWILTCVRDPIRRIRSQHRFWAAMKPETLRVTADRETEALVRLARSMTLAEFGSSEEPLLKPHVDNAMVRHFARVEGDVTEAHLAEAKAALEKMDGIIFSEKLDDGLQKVADIIGCEARFSVVRQNVTNELYLHNPELFDVVASGDEELPNGELMDALFQHIRFDIDLYAFALELTGGGARVSRDSSRVEVLGLDTFEVSTDVAYRMWSNSRSHGLLWGDWSQRDDSLAWALGGQSWIRFKVSRAALARLKSPGVAISLDAFLPSGRPSNSVDVALGAGSSRILFLNLGSAVELPPSRAGDGVERVLVVAGSQSRVVMPLADGERLLEDQRAGGQRNEDFAYFRIDLNNLPGIEASVFAGGDNRRLGVALTELKVTDMAALDAS